MAFPRASKQGRSRWLLWSYCRSDRLFFNQRIFPKLHLDIKSIEKRLHSNYYTDKEKFINDVKRIFTNARFYNQPETIYFKCANELESYILPYLHSLKDNVMWSDDESDLNQEKKNRVKAPGVKKKIMKTKN